MVNEQLFSELAKALARPSGAYRAAQAGFGAVDKGFEGYKEGSALGDEIRKRRLQRQTLGEVLGTNAPAGTENLPIEQSEMLVKPVESYASLLKAQRESKGKGLQFAGTQKDPKTGIERPVIFDPETGILAFGGLPGEGPMAPKVAPTLPASESGKLSDLETLIQDIGVVKGSYSPSFVGPVDAVGTRIKQRFGPGATPEAATFGSTVSGLRNKVLNLLSGAAISPAEAQRLMQQLPNENMSEVDFNSRLANFERELKLQLESKKSGFSKSGYRGQESSSSSKTQNNDPLGIFQ